MSIIKYMIISMHLNWLIRVRVYEWHSWFYHVDKCPQSFHIYCIREMWCIQCHWMSLNWLRIFVIKSEMCYCLCTEYIWGCVRFTLYIFKSGTSLKLLWQCEIASKCRSAWDTDMEKFCECTIELCPQKVSVVWPWNQILSAFYWLASYEIRYPTTPSQTNTNLSAMHQCDFNSKYSSSCVYWLYYNWLSDRAVS